MITIFKIQPTDQSVYYLGQIFGWVGNILPVQEASVILGTMFRVFNTTVLSVAALIVLYVSVVGIMKTAAEGEFLGRGWSSLWIPIRMVVGIAALIPTPSGYSTIQIIMMWVVLQGIGAADLVWTTVLQYTKALGSPYATVNISSVGVSNKMQNLFQMLVCQQTALINDPYTPQQGTENGMYYCAVKSDGFCGKTQADLANLASAQTENSTTVIDDKTLWNYKFGPGGKCGSLAYCQESVECASTDTMEKQMACEACRKSVSSIQTIMTTFNTVAKTFVDQDLEYRKFYDRFSKSPPDFVKNYCNANNMGGDNQCCRPREYPVPTLDSQGQLVMRNVPAEGYENCGLTLSSGGSGVSPDSDTVSQLYWPYGLKPTVGSDIDFIQAAVDRYVGDLTDSALSVVGTQVGSTSLDTGTEKEDKILRQANEQGWLFAGAYYYWLAQTTKKNAKAADPALNLTPPQGGDNPLDGLRSNYSAASNVATLANTSSQTSITSSLPPELSAVNKLSDGLESSADSVMRGIMTMLTGSESTDASSPKLATDPLVKMQYLGYVLLIVAQALFALIIAVSVTITVVGYFNVFVLGTGFENFVGPTFTTLAILFAPIVTLVLGGMFTFGALLSIYTPLIPYIIYTMGAIGWFILVIEAMIAAPLVAIGILLPGGQSEILGKAEGALMYAFSLFLRPSLMVFGMMAGMLLSVVVVTMINAGFLGVVASINTNPGLVEEFLFLGAYVGVILAALNKCFSLIHIIPDRTLRWIGGTTEDTSPGEALTGAKGGVEAAGGQAQKMGGEAAGRGKKGAAKGIQKGLKRGKTKEGETDDELEAKKEGKEDEEEEK